jgi:hypothetical protein
MCWRYKQHRQDILLKIQKEPNIMEYDILDRILAAFPKKSKKFSNWHEKKFHNATKLDNDEDPIEKVPFSSKYMHYKLCW